jgi:AraC-like DNA-binding protein
LASGCPCVIDRLTARWQDRRMDGFAGIKEGLERWIGAPTVPRHTHDKPYAAVVVAGGYEECGSHGRFRVCAGDVLAHGAFDSHLNRFHGKEVIIVNLKIADLPAARGKIADPEFVARLAERDSAAAADAVRDQFRAFRQGAIDWPDLLAEELNRAANIRLEKWANDHRLAAETVSRGFRKVFGVSPALFRQEARVRQALAMLRRGGSSLSAIAAMAGFADQAHMSRAVRALTGRTPSQIKFVQDQNGSAQIKPPAWMLNRFPHSA